MSRYKKAKHRKRNPFRSREYYPMKPSKHQAKDQRPMTGEKADNAAQETSRFRIVAGRKRRNRIRNWIIFATAVVLVGVIVLLSVLSPTGLAESIRNTVASFSFHSTLPTRFDGNELYQTEVADRYFYVVTDTSVSCLAKNGKTMFKETHGLSRPVLTTSQTRALLYDQNGTDFQIYTANHKLHSMQTEQAIYCGDICRNGTYAIATKHPNYTSAVTVYDKEYNKLYEWLCPTEFVTAVALSKDGQKLAVACVKTQNGSFVSTLRILGYQTADPLFSKEYEGEMIESLASRCDKTFAVCTATRADLVSYEKMTVIENQSDYEISFVRENFRDTVICSSRQGDSSHTRIDWYEKDGKTVNHLSFDGKIDDIQLQGNCLLILCGSRISLLDENGTVIREGSCVFGTNRLVPVSKEYCLSVSDNTVSKISLNIVA